MRKVKFELCHFSSSSIHPQSIYLSIDSSQLGHLSFFCLLTHLPFCMRDIDILSHSIAVILFSFNKVALCKQFFLDDIKMKYFFFF